MYYKESYVLRKERSPEDLGEPGKPYCVIHLLPKEGGQWVAYAGKKFFQTRIEAEAYLHAQEDRLKAKEGAKA